MKRAALWARVLLLQLALGAASWDAAQSCPSHCNCTDSVDLTELTCARDSGYTLVVIIQPGRFYSVECEPHDESVLETAELALLRAAFASLVYNATQLRRCALPARPLADLLSVLAPDPPAALTLDEPRGGFPDFSRLPNLRQLNLLRAHVAELPRGLLTALPALQQLVVRESRVPLRLDVATFSAAPALRTLELSLDGIAELPPGAFASLGELRHLYLWGNDLAKLSPGALDGLRSLEALDISRNRLRTLPTSLCLPVPALRRLNVLGNALEAMADAALANCTRLEEAKLERGGMRELPEGLLTGSGALLELSLASQRLSSLPLLLLRDQRLLVRLDLSGNRLQQLTGGFSSLASLVHLTLDDNLIEELPSGLFEGLGALQDLSVQRNRLARVSPFAFRGVVALRALRLAHNRLRLQEAREAREAQSPFGAITTLQLLDLGHNEVAELFDDWRFVLLQLRTLNLTNNRIRALNNRDLAFLAEAVVVDVRHNNVSAMDFATAHTFEQLVGPSASRTSVLLDGNPFRCDCELSAAVQRASLRPRLVWDAARCAHPPELRGARLAALSAEKLVCELGACAEPASGCSCRARPAANRTLEVRCTAAAHLPRVDLAEAGSRWLLGRTAYRLAGSAVAGLGPDQPEAHVALLDLRNNSLARLDADGARRLLAPGRSLWLAGNPLACDCDNEPFVAALRDHRAQILDYELVRCASGQPLRELPPGGPCVRYGLPLAAALALLAVLLVALTLLYQRFEHETKVWLYARGLCTRWLTERDLDRDKLYDAFVSFSHLDEAFVVGELVPALEAGPQPLRLCVHVRDWPAGEWIPAQIARSVEQSRRTIVVLSPNFLESVWGQVEFRAAHAAALREGRARVVVVLYGEAPNASRLDPELRAYLSTNTYIKWGDPYFWRKLRFELPHHRAAHAHAPPLSELAAARHKGFDDRLELRVSAAV